MFDVGAVALVVASVAGSSVPRLTATVNAELDIAAATVEAGKSMPRLVVTVFGDLIGVDDAVISTDVHGGVTILAVDIALKEHDEHRHAKDNP